MEVWRRVVRTIISSTASRAGGPADTCNGTLLNAGWGAGLGYPALVLGTDGSAVEVDVFASPDLPEHGSRLDEFEGAGYVRVVTTVTTASGHIDAFIYVLRSEPSTP
jgi:gamma-glutamylcyclotransferase (GGCT)/AIG2-like uncharacterized protein YtfP